MSLLNDFCENRNALIVGGSSGIGLATAKLLANEGVNVVLVGKNGSKLEEAVKAVSTFTNVSTISINAVQVDLYKPADVQKLIKYVEDAAVPFHYLINAAGYFNPKPFLQHTCEDYDVYHDLNKSLFFITQAVAKRMSQHSVGSIVNVERSLKVGERLEGHFVLGHVDGVAQIKKIEKKPKEVKIWFKIPKNLKKYVVEKGSIALDGISLTVVDVKNDLGSVCLIPHTIQITNFKTKNIEDKLNIETDVLGKYILK